MLATIIERSGHFVRLEGVSGLVLASDLAPCSCGGRLFRAGRKALYCVRCCKIPKYETGPLEEIELPKPNGKPKGAT